jgi:hypothetical protein
VRSTGGVERRVTPVVGHFGTVVVAVAWAG